MNFLKKISLLAGIISIVYFNTAKATLPNSAPFAGHWVINLIKSDFKGLDPAYAVAATMIIHQTSSDLIMQRFYNDRMLALDTLSLAGKPFVSIDTLGGYIRTSVLTLQREGFEMTVASDYKDDGRGKFTDMKRSEIYNISSDKKEMILLREFDLPDGKVVVKAVFDLFLPFTENKSSVPIKPNFEFSGKWLLDAGQSYIGATPPNFVFSTIEIKQSGNELIIESQRDNFPHEILQIKLDGSLQKLNEEIIGDYFAKITWDTKSKRAVLDFESKIRKWRHYYTLSDDGKLLTVYRLNISPVANTEVCIYKRAD